MGCLLDLGGVWSINQDITGYIRIIIPRSGVVISFIVQIVRVMEGPVVRVNDPPDVMGSAIIVFGRRY